MWANLSPQTAQQLLPSLRRCTAIAFLTREQEQPAELKLSGWLATHPRGGCDDRRCCSEGAREGDGRLSGADPIRGPS